MSLREPGEVDGMANLRDVGGLALHDGGTIATGVLYRGDAPHVDDSRPAEVPHWPPRVVVDLRDAREREPEHALLDSARVHHMPLLDGARAAAGSSRLDLITLYDFMLEHAGARLAEVCELIAHAPGPVLVHCAAGKDRTGVVVALLCLAAGAREDAVVADYVATGAHMPAVLRRLRAAPTLPPGVRRGEVDDLTAAPVTAIEHVIERLRQHGGARAWLREHGVAEEVLDAWCARLTAR